MVREAKTPTSLPNTEINGQEGKQTAPPEKAGEKQCSRTVRIHCDSGSHPWLHTRVT